MSSRRRLGAISALVLGSFLGLTLLPIAVTGPVGRVLGNVLWNVLGAGAVGLPLLGLGLALAGFDRLPRLDMKRAAFLIGGLSLLVPYIIGVATRLAKPELLPDFAGRTLAAKAVGVLPGFFAILVRDRIGVAGALLLGFLALSALTLLTFAWHPLQRLERLPRAPDAPEPERRARSRRAAPAVVELDEDDDAVVPPAPAPAPALAREKKEREKEKPKEKKPKDEKPKEEKQQEKPEETPKPEENGNDHAPGGDEDSGGTQPEGGMGGAKG